MSIGGWAAVSIACAALAAPARAAVQTRELEYREGDTVLQGFLAWNDAAQGKRPGVLVIHEWWGNNAHARAQAHRLAQAGYVGFALDMYGKGKVAEHPKDAMAFVQEATKDQAVLKARFEAAMRLLKEQPQVDPAHVAAIGYCFGGSVALAMARAGEPLDAVVTFHGAPPPPGPAAGKIKTHVLIQTGGADPMVPKEKVDAMAKELRDAGAGVKVITYHHAKHSFTNPDAAKTGMEGLAYDAEADRRSWAAMLDFFKKYLRG